MAALHVILPGEMDLSRACPIVLVLPSITQISDMDEALNGVIRFRKQTVPEFQPTVSYTAPIFRSLHYPHHQSSV